MDSHEEWLKSLTHGEERVLTVKEKIESDKYTLMIAFAILVLAFLVRLIFIYKFTDPQNPGDGWAGDTFHHWQIAYLTQEIGLKEGFLRLWDLKGMEFFWGPLHPILMIILFAITGSVSIEIPRILSSFFWCYDNIFGLSFSK